MKKNVRKYLSVIIFIVFFNIILVLATAVVHEQGHSFLGHYYGCKNIKIIMFDSENSGTYTQMSCSDDVPTNILLLGGFLFTIPLGIILYLMRGFPERFFSLIVIGFNFTISSSDINLLTGESIFPIIVTIIGMAIIIAGEMLLINKILESAFPNTPKDTLG